MKFRNKLRPIIIVLVIITLGFAACSKLSAPTTPNPNNLSGVQQNKYLTARLYGLMTFDYSGTTVSSPAELIISSVPISWMGQIFDGKSESIGPGNDVTDQVHGSVSADGDWILLLTYSRQIAKTGQKSVFYRISLKNIPIAQVNKDIVTENGTFEQAGDVQKYVDRIEYSNGIFTDGEIVPDITYVSTDWSNTAIGLQPSLKLAFEVKPSQILGPMPPQQPGMGMGRSTP